MKLALWAEEERGKEKKRTRSEEALDEVKWRRSVSGVQFSHSPSDTRSSHAGKEKSPRAGVNPKESRKSCLVNPQSLEEEQKVDTEG